MMFKASKTGIAAVALFSLLLSACNDDNKKEDPTTAVEKSFNRVSSFLVCTQIDSTCDTDDETAAEIVASSVDGNTLIYSDSPAGVVGFVNITDPVNPIADGTVSLTGEPTSVAIKDEYVLVGVNTSENFVDVSGELAVIDIESKTVVASIDLGGQPDSVAVSKDGAYAAIVIENERDEDLGEGEPPQAPAGSLSIINLDESPDTWVATSVDLTGLADLYPTDPEPEYVDINDDNIAVVTLQENNHLVLVDLVTSSVSDHYNAGSVDLEMIDATEEEPAIISLTESQAAVPREADGVAWIDNTYFVTADEGDLQGGSRGFTIYHKDGSIVYTSGNSLDHMAVRSGHYPDGRSGNKGNEPENVEVGTFDGTPYLFVNSERSSLVFVYDVTDPTTPVYQQTLAAAAGPEGGLAIPERDLLIVASEVDDRGDKLRSVLNIYRYAEGDPQYPTITSDNRSNGTPIPWSALSGLSASVSDNTLYAVDDSFYGQSRILRLDTSSVPAILNQELVIKDDNDQLAALPVVDVAEGIDDDAAARINVFDSEDLAALINADKSINIDSEGIAKASDGGFWIASEGSGTKNDTDRPINSLNMIIKTDAEGVIETVVTLPEAINNEQLRFGFEGVTEYNGSVYVAFQRAWGTDENPRIGAYDVAAESWRFFFYPLDEVASQNGGWVGLSDITSLGDGQFVVIERDNQGGPDAAIKRLYRFDTNGLADGDVVSKTLLRDLISEGDLTDAGGLVYEKIEGLAISTNNEVYIVNDNDGVDDNSGETQLINLGNILP